MTSASALARSALGLEQEGNPNTGEAFHCSLCRALIPTGGLSAPVEFSSAFTDWASIGDSGRACGDCNATTHQPVLRKLQRGVITAEGVYPIGSDDNRAWFLLTPPEPPFAAVVSTRSATAAFHLHWKAQITIDRDFLVVQLDDQAIYIRRPVLLAALDACQRVANGLQAMRPESRKRESLRHPYVALDRSATDPAHGVLHPETGQLGPEHAEDLQLLRKLWPGETWALATLAKANAPTPTRPELITSIEGKAE